MLAMSAKASERQKKAEAETLLVKKHIGTAFTAAQNIWESVPQGKKPKIIPQTPHGAARSPGSVVAGRGGARGTAGSGRGAGKARCPHAQGLLLSLQGPTGCTANPLRLVPVMHLLSKGHDVVDNTEIATRLNAWRAVGKVTSICSSARGRRTSNLMMGSCLSPAWQ